MLILTRPTILRDMGKQPTLSTSLDLIYINPAPVSEVEPPFNSNRNYEVFCGGTKERRAFEDDYASAQGHH